MEIHDFSGINLINLEGIQMAISITLAEYLDNEGIDYDLVTHPHTSSSLESAESAHIPGDKLAKCVVLGDGRGYVLAVIPSTHRLELDSLQQYLGCRCHSFVMSQWIDASDETQ